MSVREVTKSRKDSDGDITALCNTGEIWSPRYKANAISDIESCIHSYYVDVPGTGRVKVVVINDKVKGKYLRTDPDKTIKNNLDELPDC